MKNWPIKKLGEVAEVDWGNTSITKKQYVKSGYSAFSATGQDGSLPFYEHEGLGIVLSAIGARCGKCFLANGKWTAIKNTIIIIPKEEVDIRFLFYFLNDESKWRQSGAAQPFISQASAKSLEIPVPGIEEQRRIVKKLKKILAKIEEASALRQGSVEEVKLILKSASAKTFSDKKFNKRKIKEVVTTETRRNTNRTLPYIGMEDIESDTGTLLGNPQLKSVKSTTFYFDDSHILYGKLRPYLNKVFLPDFKGHCTTEFIPLKPRKDLNRKFLALWLRSPSVVERLSDRTTGTRMPRADMNLLMDLEIPTPDLQEQDKIVAYLDGLSEKVQALQKLQQEQLQDLEALQQSVLHQAFQGEL